MNALAARRSETGASNDVKRSAVDKPLHVLIVEDCDDDAALLLRVLQAGALSTSHEVVQTRAAFESALDRATWDIVLCDWSMPDFSAPEVLESLKRRGNDVPVIIVSGSIDEETGVLAMRCGAHDFMLKGRLGRLVPAVRREVAEAETRRERDRMREELAVFERMASVGILAAGIAHEINNPLASVLANVELAFQAAGGQHGSPAVASELVEALTDAREAAAHLRDVVKDLRMFCRSEAESRGPVDVRRVLDSALRMARNEIRHRARVVTRYASVPLVLADASRLGQVFLNLVVNAAQSIREGDAARNEIRVAAYCAEDGRVVAELSDTGSGMSPDVVERLFTPFFTTKSRDVGTGLGLAICDRIVKTLGGEITVMSEPGRGSTFRVLLPPHVPAEAPPAAEKIAMTRPVARRGRILVVDDDPLVLAVVRRILIKEHDVNAVASARDAVALVRAGEPFDVILSDVMMPDMTGVELSAELAAFVPDLSDRLIFLTGGAFTEETQRLLDDTRNARLEKPFDPEALRAIVNERVK